MKKAVSVILMLAILISSMTINGSAATCVHSWSPTYCTAAHPHAYYQVCYKCRLTVYTGGYATKSHSVCSACGSHSFSGTSCTTSGTCSCGATTPALGHNWSPTYSQAAHPHAYYHQCYRCSAVEYTGGYATKAHGTGAYGSGTCPSCGSHSFAGTSCETSGTCVCGATTPALGHDWYAVYADAAHPHQMYDYCMRTCKRYLEPAQYATKNHGNGAYGSGTCPSCGVHTWVTTYSSDHPHPGTTSCICGSSSTVGNDPDLHPDCSICYPAPTLSYHVIFDIEIGDSVNIDCDSTQPCYRMSAKVIHNGTDTWLGDIYSNEYHKSFTPNDEGTYTITVYTRSYPESDPRTRTSEVSFSFMVSHNWVVGIDSLHTQSSPHERCQDCTFCKAHQHLGTYPTLTWGATEWREHDLDGHDGYRTCTTVDGCTYTEYIGHYPGQYPDCYSCARVSISQPTFPFPPDLVDSGKHLDWDGTTIYMDTYIGAIATWEDYIFGVIRQDTTETIQDVAIADYYNEIDDYAGRTTINAAGYGWIEFNTYEMDTLSSSQKKSACLHELGHALGLEHNIYLYDIMYDSITSQSPTILSINDKASYDAAYERY